MMQKVYYVCATARFIVIHFLYTKGILVHGSTIYGHVDDCDGNKANDQYHIMIALLQPYIIIEYFFKVKTNI